MFAVSELFQSIKLKPVMLESCFSLCERTHKTYFHNNYLLCFFERSIFFLVGFVLNLVRHGTCLNNMYRMNTCALVNFPEPWKNNTSSQTEWSNSNPQSSAALLHTCYHSCTGTHVLMHSSYVQALKSPSKPINSICAGAGAEFSMKPFAGKL